MPKQFVSIPDAGHNDLYDYGLQEYVIEFLSGLSDGN